MRALLGIILARGPARFNRGAPGFCPKKVSIDPIAFIAGTFGPLVGADLVARAHRPSQVDVGEEERHDAAYYAELGRWFPQLAPPAHLPRERMLEHWNAALRSDAGAAAIARTFEAAIRRDSAKTLR